MNTHHYRVRLLEFTGGQTLFGPYAVPTAPVDAGAIAVDFADDTHGTITWPGGVGAIEREIFGSGPATFQPQSGWWWNPAESGSGYSMEVQGNTVFLVGFMYDAAGKPVWDLSAAPDGRLGDAESIVSSCAGSAAKTFAFKDLLSSLLVSDSAQYTIQIGMAAEDLQVSVPVTCTFFTNPPVTRAAGPYIAGDPIKIISAVEIAGNISLTGSIGPTQETPNVKRTGSWQLFPIGNGF